MFDEASELCQDISVLTRLCFAAKYLNKETPRYWEFVKAIGFKSMDRKPDSKQVEIFMQNLQYLDSDALEVNQSLVQQMQQLEGFQGHPLGIVLLSANNICRLCGGNLLVRADRPSFPVIHQELQGTTCGTHFRKYCQNNHKGCSFMQHYGFIQKELSRK